MIVRWTQHVLVHAAEVIALKQELAETHEKLCLVKEKNKIFEAAFVKMLGDSDAGEKQK